MLISLLLALAADPVALPSTPPMAEVSTNNPRFRPIPTREQRATNAPAPIVPIVLQSTPVPLPPPATHPLAVYILPEVWAIQTAPNVIYLTIPEHNFRDLAKLFPASTFRMTNVVVTKEVLAQ